MNNKKYNINKFFLIKIYKRNINNEFLIKTLQDMLIYNNRNLDLDKNINDSLLKLESTKLVNKQEPIVYDNILKNLEESEKLLANIRENLKIVKKNNYNLTIEVKNIENEAAKIKIDNLNNITDYYRDNNASIDILKKDNLDLDKTINLTKDTISTVKKNIWDMSWLHPFMSFLHNNSSLILTIGSGLVIGGIWYFNNVGLINIGNLLNRLGINILSNDSTTSLLPPPTSSLPSTNITIELPIASNNREIEHGFFRQLGKRVIEMLDIFIQKMKDKRKPYK